MRGHSSRTAKLAPRSPVPAQRSGSGERRVLPSRERDALTPEEKMAAVRMLAPHIYQGKANQAEIIEAGSLGSKDSAHDVFFARSEGHPEGPIAIKRYRRSSSATYELEAIMESKRRGFTTLDPVGEGLFSLGEMGEALVTRRLPRFTTMNQVGWQNYYAGTPEYEDVAASLRAISGFIGGMHDRRVIHHDLQMKNIGQIPPGDFVLFDLEDAQFFDPADDSYEFHDWCIADLSDMARSLVAHGYLSDATDHIFQEELTANVLDPYIAVNPSERVLDGWQQVMDVAMYERHHGDRAMAGAAMGHLMIANA